VTQYSDGRQENEYVLKVVKNYTDHDQIKSAKSCFDIGDH